MDLTNTVWRDCLQQHTHLKQSKQQILKPVSSATPFQKSCFEVVRILYSPIYIPLTLHYDRSTRALRLLRNFWMKIEINI
jgi:hypothetical protein